MTTPEDSKAIDPASSNTAAGNPRTRAVELGYWNPATGAAAVEPVGGVALGLVLFASYVLTGNGLGGSGGLARVMVCGLDQVAPRRSIGTRTLPTMAGGDNNPLDHRWCG